MKNKKLTIKECRKWMKKYCVNFKFLDAEKSINDNEICITILVSASNYYYFYTFSQTKLGLRYTVESLSGIVYVEKILMYDYDTEREELLNEKMV